MNPAQITVVGADNQLMPVNVPAWFEIRGAVASATDADLVVNIICQYIHDTYHCASKLYLQITSTNIGQYQ